jgi:hypothetical protein
VWTRFPGNERTRNNGKTFSVRSMPRGNLKEGERSPLEAATKQRLVKTEKTLCVLQLQ